MKAALVLALLAAAPIAAQEGGDWRRIATKEDRLRLREWRGAWLEGLEAARKSDGVAVMAAGDLLAPDRALARAMPPAGAYRCRLVRLGTRRGDRPGFADRPPVGCRIGEEGRFEVTEGIQRPVGRLYADDDARAVFLGSLRLSEETRGLPYGRDSVRNIAGYVERIGQRRWRLVLPRPRFDAVIDVFDIQPQESGGRVAR